MLEIYKETLYDLINPNTKSSDLKIKEHPQKGIYVQNLTEEYITSREDFLNLIEEADRYRVVFETLLNKVSSRSHLLFLIDITQKYPNGVEKRGILNLVDLAGSEKISKSGAVGETLEEAKKINLSLLNLGNVINALTSHNEHVPYRDSKLTRILQDSLGGNYKTTLIVTCSPHSGNVEETLSTLKFAQRAKKIKNKVKVNIKRSNEELEMLLQKVTNELLNAKQELLRVKGSSSTFGEFYQKQKNSNEIFSDIFGKINMLI
jgi:kinesin family protein 5